MVIKAFLAIVFNVFRKLPIKMCENYYKFTGFREQQPGKTLI